jgi:hypothetical protein
LLYAEEKEKRVVVPPTQWVAYATAYGMSVVADVISTQQAFQRGDDRAHLPLAFTNRNHVILTQVAAGAFVTWGMTVLHKTHPKAAHRTIIALTLLNFAVAIRNDDICQPDSLGNATCPR